MGRTTAISKIKNNSVPIYMIFGTTTFYFFTLYMRVRSGYFNDPLWIALSSFAYILFFATMTGIVIAKIAPFMSKK